MFLALLTLFLSTDADAATIARCATPPDSAVPALKKATVRLQTMAGSGSGVIISPDGWILSAAHVVGTAKQVKELVEVAVTVDQIHVRTHIAWAVQDMIGNRKKAITSFGKLQGRPGAVGARAKEMMGVLLDEISDTEKYKQKLEVIRSFFTPKRGVKLPKLKAPKEHRETLERVITGMKEKVPAYYHLICTVVDTIEVSSGDWRFDHKRGAVNIRYADILKWDRDELFEYYLVRYASIICLGKLGDPTLGHRGWEEGMIDGWWYAMDHTLIALPETLKGYVKSFLRAPPW